MQAESLLERIAETGLLGVFLVLALFAIFYLYKECKMERNARLEDIKEFSEVDKSILGEIKNTLQLVLSLLSNKQK